MARFEEEEEAERAEKEARRKEQEEFRRQFEEKQRRALELKEERRTQMQELLAEDVGLRFPEDEEIEQHVRHLESMMDEANLPEASGDAIAAEFERFLRRREGGPGKSGE